MKTLKGLIHQWRNKAHEANTARLSHDKRRHELSVELFNLSATCYKLKERYGPINYAMLPVYEKRIEELSNELFWLEVFKELNINQ